METSIMLVIIELMKLDKLSHNYMIYTDPYNIVEKNEHTLSNLMSFFDTGYISKIYILNHHMHILSIEEIMNLYDNNPDSYAQSIIDIKKGPDNIWNVSKNLMYQMLELLSDDMIMDVTKKYPDIDINYYINRCMITGRTIQISLLDSFYLKLSHRTLYSLMSSNVIPDEHYKSLILHMLPTNNLLNNLNITNAKRDIINANKHMYIFKINDKYCNTWDELEYHIDMFKISNIRYSVMILNGNKYIKLRMYRARYYN